MVNITNPSTIVIGNCGITPPCPIPKSDLPFFDKLEEDNEFYYLHKNQFRTLPSYFYKNPLVLELIDYASNTLQFILCDQSVDGMINVEKTMVYMSSTGVLNSELDFTYYETYGYVGFANKKDKEKYDFVFIAQKSLDKPEIYNAINRLPTDNRFITVYEEGKDMITYEVIYSDSSEEHLRINLKDTVVGLKYYVTIFEQYDFGNLNSGYKEEIEIELTEDGDRLLDLLGRPNFIRVSCDNLSSARDVWIQSKGVSLREVKNG